MMRYFFAHKDFVCIRKKYYMCIYIYKMRKKTHNKEV